MENKLRNNTIKENTIRYFCNKECKQYPCHEIPQDGYFNCLFCLCPLYKHPNCEGNFKVVNTENGQIKDCTECNIPHNIEKYNFIIEKMIEIHNIKITNDM